MLLNIGTTTCPSKGQTELFFFIFCPNYLTMNLPSPHSETPSTNLTLLPDLDKEESGSNSQSEDTSNQSWTSYILHSSGWKCSIAQEWTNKSSKKIKNKKRVILHPSATQEGSTVRFQFQRQCQTLLLHFIQCLLQVKCIYYYEFTLHLPYKQRIHSVFFFFFSQFSI